jgi:hypothetical protein
LNSRLRSVPRRGLSVALLVAVSGGTLALAAPGPVGAATQIGETFDPAAAGDCGSVFTYLQPTSPAGQYAAPSAGVITAWSYQAAGSPPQLKLKVARPGLGDSFAIVGESPPKDPLANQLNTYTDVRIAVQAGDVIGMTLTALGECGREASGYTTHTASGDPPPGTTVAFPPDPPGFQLDVAATLEADCDSDGFGDETQDPEVPLGGACPKADRTLVLDANKNKVKKGKRVRLSGRVTELARQGECQSGQTVTLQRKRPKATTFTTVQQLETDAVGSFSTKRKVKKTFEYRAQVAETATCGEALSNTEKVKVKKPK